MAKIKDMSDKEIRELIPTLLEEKEAKHREVIQKIQSLCSHIRRGVISQEGHNVVYCQGCLKPFYDMDV